MVFIVSTLVFWLFFGVFLLVFRVVVGVSIELIFWLGGADDVSNCSAICDGACAFQGTSTVRPLVFKTGEENGKHRGNGLEFLGPFLPKEMVYFYIFLQVPTPPPTWISF